MHYFVDARCHCEWNISAKEKIIQIRCKNQLVWHCWLQALNLFMMWAVICLGFKECIFWLQSWSNMKAVEITLFRYLWHLELFLTVNCSWNLGNQYSMYLILQVTCWDHMVWICFFVRYSGFQGFHASSLLLSSESQIIAYLSIELSAEY